MDSAASEDSDLEQAFTSWQRRRPPRNEIPASLPVDAVIGSSADVVVFVASLSIYTNGISFTTEVRARGGPENDDGRVSLLEGMLGEAFDPTDLGASRPVPGRMLLGVEFADGRRCISTPRGQEAPADEPLLLNNGGSGDAGVGSAEWFLSPFPPPGDLRLYCAWPSSGIPETITIISADDLLEAARRVQQLWPPPRVSDQQPHPSPEPLVRDGWFTSFGESQP